MAFPIASVSAPATPAVVPGPGLLFGLMLLAAIVGGYSARWLHVPRVIGFVLGGVALRAALLELLPARDDGTIEKELADAAAPLKAIKDLALGLILFTIGGVFERTRLRAVGPRITRLSLLETTLCGCFVLTGCFVVTRMTLPGGTASEHFILALLMGLAAIATAPAATVFVLQEYEAKGPTTDTILALTGINNIICIVLFYTAFFILASLGGLSATGPISAHLWLALTGTTLGSVALGILAGLLISMIHVKLPMAETMLVFFALFILLGAGENWLLAHVGVAYNFLLTSLILGAVFANVALDAPKLNNALRTVASPIFAGFFVMAGYDLHVGDLARMGWLGAAYVLCRLAGKVLGCHLGVKWVGGAERVGARLGASLLCQAAVVIGLASFVKLYWQSELAHRFATVILGSVVVFELIGPILVKRCVVYAGEVKAVTLMRRAGAAGGDGSVVVRTLRAFLRMFGYAASKQPAKPEAMAVKHLMRTNVQLIPASASLDEVLHLIERSTYTHFPVVDDEGNYVGVIHFSDVRDVIYDPMIRDLVTAFDFADAESAVVHSDMPLNELLDIFTRENVAVLPVVDRPGSKRIVGLVEQRDLLRVMAGRK